MAWLKEEKQEDRKAAVGLHVETCGYKRSMNMKYLRLKKTWPHQTINKFLQTIIHIPREPEKIMSSGEDS